MKLRVKDHDLVRDSRNHGLLATNRELIRLHETKIEQLQRERRQQEILISHEDEINSIKNDLSEIKALVQQLLHKEN